MMIERIVCIVALLVLFGCKEQSMKESLDNAAKSLAKDPFKDTAQYPRIYFAQNGSITLNGRTSSIEEVDSKLKVLKLKDGIVFYATDNPISLPRKDGPVIALISKYGLAFKLFSDKKFSNSVE